MPKGNERTQLVLEVFLVTIVLSLACLLYKTVGYKPIIFHFFFLPVVLAGFYLGRYRAGVFALLSVISASAVTALDLTNFAAFTSPLVIGLAVVVWGGILGLTALLVGTLSDERTTKMVELHEAYVGVIEVLSRYLQSANPRLEARSSRVAELSQKVAAKLKLSSKESDDIRVAALLHDMENIEITAKVIRKAIGNIQSEQECLEHTFNGTDLVHSLGSVLSGALPLLLNQSRSDDVHMADEVPIGAKIIRTVRVYCQMLDGDWSHPTTSPQAVLEELRHDPQTDHNLAVLNALQDVVQSEQPAPEPVAVPQAEPELAAT